MDSAKLLIVVLGAMMALAITAPVSHATQANQMTKITINTPFQVPGHETLAAGTYWFRTLGNNGGSNVVEIYNGNKTKLLETALTRPTIRLVPANRTELSFATASRQTPTLVRWFYPGLDTGYAFIYSPKTERKIHEENVKNVMSTSVAG
jgi:hypothetical protein